MNNDGKPPSLPVIDFSKRRRDVKPLASPSTQPTASSPWPTQQPVTTAAHAELQKELDELHIARSQSNGTLKLSPTGTEYKFAINDLEDLGQIGGGSFGSVMKMRHKTSGRLMAVKRIQSIATALEQKNMLMDLDVTTKSDKCPYIVRFYGAIFREGDCWICMQLMDISLDKLYRTVNNTMEEKMPEDIIAKIAHARELQVIHRDVKPSNILLNTQGDIKLCDFGIAGQLVDSIAKTRDAGCRPYMAPERLTPVAKPYGAQVDVWSLGITLVEIATGRFPYKEWTNVFDQLHAVIEGDPPILTPNDGFSLQLVLFVSKCLIKDPSLRYNYDQLVKLPFVVDAEVSKVDVAGYVTRVTNVDVKEKQRQWVQF